MKGDPSSCKKTEIKKFFLHWFDCVVSLIFKRFSMASLQKELISRIESLQIDSIGSVSKCRSRFCFEFQLFFLWRFSNFFFFCIVTICFSWCHFKSVPGIFHLHKPCKKNGYWENVCEFFFFFIKENTTEILQTILVQENVDRKCQKIIKQRIL